MLGKKRAVFNWIQVNQQQKEATHTVCHQTTRAYSKVLHLLHIHENISGFCVLDLARNQPWKLLSSLKKNNEEVSQRPPCHFPGEHRKPLTSHWGCLSDGWMRPRDQLRKWDTQQDAVFSLTLLAQALTAGMSLDFNQMGILNQGVSFQYVVKPITQPEVKVHGDTWPVGLKSQHWEWQIMRNHKHA